MRQPRLQSYDHSLGLLLTVLVYHGLFYLATPLTNLFEKNKVVNGMIIVMMFVHS